MEKTPAPVAALTEVPKNWESIDFLRAIGILGVVLYHCIYPAFRLPPLNLASFFTKPWGPNHWLFPLTFSSIRVPLFFVISGFCIHWSWLRSKNWSVGSFFWRRFWRLYPAYLVALIVFILMNTGWPIKWTKHGGNILTHVFLVHNFDPKFFKAYNGSFWTLAVEVQLYLLYPALLWLRGRFGMQRTLIGLCLGANLLRLATLPWAFDDRGKTLLVLTDATFLHWFDWAVGAFMAEKMFARERAFSRWPLWPIFLLWLLADRSKWTAFWKFSLATLFAAIVMERLLLWENAGGRLSRWRGIAWLQPIGIASYSLYLWHLPLIDWGVKVFSRWMQNPWAIYAALNFLVVPLLIGGCLFSHRWLEMKGVRFGNWLGAQTIFKRKNTRVVQSPLVGERSSS